MNPRRAAVAYVSYMVGRKAAKHVVRRTVRRAVTRVVEPRKQRRRWLPVAGGVAAVSVGVLGAAVVATRSRG
jgi:cytochrome c biogenesis protein CcdA